MTETWLLASLWPGLALIATLFSIRLRIATALSEIVVGTVAQLILGATKRDVSHRSGGIRSAIFRMCRRGLLRQDGTGPLFHQ